MEINKKLIKQKIDILKKEHLFLLKILAEYPKESISHAMLNFGLKLLELKIEILKTLFIVGHNPGHPEG